MSAAHSGRQSRISFVELVLQKGYLNIHQVEDCLRAQEEMRARGIQTSLDSIMRERRLLTGAQVQEILRELPGGEQASLRAPTPAPGTPSVARPSGGDQKTVTELQAFTADPDDTASLPPGFRGTPEPVPTRRPVSGLLQVPGYAIEKKLGEGAMGAVYKAKHAASGRSVAIKVLPPHLAGNKEYVARFRREAEAAMRLRHPNIVEGIELGEADGSQFFVMEFVDGETLEARLKRDKQVPPRDAINYAIGVARALECAARERIVHRDLKPANILISSDGQPKLVDLGLAKQAGGGGPQLTRVGMIMGSPFYLAPEQAQVQPLDSRTDLYGLGATLYHLVTGHVPFEGDPLEVMEQTIHAAPRDPRMRNAAISPGLSKLILRLLAKKKEDRYQTPADLREALEHLKAYGYLPGERAPGFRGWLKSVFGMK